MYDRTISDRITDLELLYTAQRHLQETEEDPAYAELATTHALTTIRNQFRQDGGTYHVLTYDPKSGQVIKRWAAQGFGDESTWARGQAWAIHGFARSAQMTDLLARADGQTGTFLGRQEFVQQAKLAADYFIFKLDRPPAFVPAW